MCKNCKKLFGENEMILNKAVKRVRQWIQWNAYNGSSVTWGSCDVLNLK